MSRLLGRSVAHRSGTSAIAVCPIVSGLFALRLPEVKLEEPTDLPVRDARKVGLSRFSEICQDGSLANVTGSVMSTSKIHLTHPHPPAPTSDGRLGGVPLPIITPPPGSTPLPVVPHTPTRRTVLIGRFRYHHDFHSNHLGNKRTLIVYLPPGYETRPERRYPVLYLHDGQNVFDPATSFTGVSWRANEAAERLILTRRIRPIIMVGIYNTPDRIQEYTIHVDPKMQGGKGHLYGRFLFEEVKPFIDLNYRTLPGRQYTGLAGSSLGGQISLALAITYHDQFRYCAALSPSLWWARGALLRDLDGAPRWLRRMRFWIDMGTKEGKLRGDIPYGISRTRKLIEHFDKAGLLPGHDYVYWEVTGGEHSEVHWSRRFDKVLLYFFGRHPKRHSRRKLPRS